jgi:hypothetical protein
MCRIRIFAVPVFADGFMENLYMMTFRHSLPFSLVFVAAPFWLRQLCRLEKLTRNRFS